ncbi:MAG: hypothetical protein AB1758_27925, partial [Candidatus Eremiobacterota bacterium]
GEPHDGRMGLQPLVRWVSLSARAPDGIAHDWETRPFEEAERIQWETLLDLLEFAGQRSPFYRESLHPVTSREDFLRLPLLERRHLHGQPERLLTGPLEDAVVLRSGGSTGDPKYCFLSPQDYRADVLCGVKMLRALGIRPGDRCANLFLSGDLYGSFLSIHRVLEESGVVNFPFTSGAPLDSLRLHFERFGIQAVLGVSAFLSRLLPDLRAPSLRTVVYGGEPLPQSERERLGRLGIERIGSLLGANDGGPIGYQCAHCRGSVHHLASDHILLEILEGELVITCLNRRLMPLIRYRLGDRGRWIPGPCDCGRTTPRFELLGRADDLLCLASTNTAWSDVAALVPGPVQLVAEKRDGIDCLRVLAECDADPDALRQALLERLPVLRARLDEGLLAELTVEVGPPGWLLRHPRSGKLVRVVDRRV